MRRILSIAFCAVVFLFSCKEENVATESAHVSTYKVAVIAPVSWSQWKNTAMWALDNIRDSQSSLSEQIDLELVWVDEIDKYLPSRMKKILADSSFVAVIGPVSSEQSKVIAGYDMMHRTPLIFPCATSLELHRMYANCDYIWHMSANDIDEIGIIMKQAMSRGIREVHLLAHDDEYGETFLSWAPFVADQVGCSMGMVSSYNEEDGLIRQFKEIAARPQASADMLLFVPSSVDDELALDAYLSELSDNEKSTLPLIVCSTDYVSQVSEWFSSDLLEGIELAAPAESGFNDLYRTFFGKEALSGEAQFYDSFLLLSLALTHMEATGSSLNESLTKMAHGEGSKMTDWRNLTDAYRAAREGECPDLVGASGDLTFKKETNDIEHSTYRYWRANWQSTETIGYLNTNTFGQGAGSIDLDSWKGEADHDFLTTSDPALTYPPLDNCWALLVAGTTGWTNYRHQADVYAMYQLLRQKGYAKDHIITIAEDDIAYHRSNLYPGVVHVLPDGENVYKDIHINYKLRNLKPSDLGNILCGNPSGTVREVFPSDKDDNVFIYWCGEGDRNELEFGDNVVTGQQWSSYLHAMSDNGRFRKVFFALESCYSGSIGKQLEGIPGLLCITAANENETSKADVADPSLGVWLSNGFTRGFMKAITDDSDISFYDLYFRLASSTWGSHVSIYNEYYFGSLYDNRMSEFFPLSNQ